jgi:hypothetical protein
MTKLSVDPDFLAVTVAKRCAVHCRTIVCPIVFFQKVSAGLSAEKKFARSTERSKCKPVTKLSAKDSPPMTLCIPPLSVASLPVRQAGCYASVSVASGH